MILYCLSMNLCGAVGNFTQLKKRNFKIIILKQVKAYLTMTVFEINLQKSLNLYTSVMQCSAFLIKTAFCDPPLMMFRDGDEENGFCVLKLLQNLFFRFVVYNEASYLFHEKLIKFFFLCFRYVSCISYLLT